jgi:T3SS negative regulator,GrlR
MLEALWSVEFVSNQPMIGSGVAVIETGRVLGGDSSFMYVGTIEIKDGQAHLKIKCTRYSNVFNMQSVLGPYNEFTILVSGPINRDVMTLQGKMIEDPSKQIVIKATRRQELP